MLIELVELRGEVAVHRRGIKSFDRAYNPRVDLGNGPNDEQDAHDR